jgi:hypothetical protein
MNRRPGLFLFMVTVVAAWLAAMSAETPSERDQRETLEKLHRGEIIANTNRGYSAMRQQREAEPRRNYQLAKQRQELQLAAAHVTWTAQQWQQWDGQYDLEQQKLARDNLKAVEPSGQMGREQAARDAAERIRKAAE